MDLRKHLNQLKLYYTKKKNIAINKAVKHVSYVTVSQDNLLKQIR